MNAYKKMHFYWGKFSIPYLLACSLIICPNVFGVERGGFVNVGFSVTPANFKIFHAHQSTTSGNSYIFSGPFQKLDAPFAEFTQLIGLGLNRPAYWGPAKSIFFPGTKKEFIIAGSVFFNGNIQYPKSSVIVIGRQDDTELSITTSQDGNFSFLINDGSSILLTASLAHGVGKANQGVDVADIVELRKHILARERFNLSLKMIAGDVNRDASVDVADIVAMRKVILARTDYFSIDGNGDKEPFWRFVGLEFLGISAETAFDQVESYEKIHFSSLSSDLSEVDFAAIKVGDVNGDWTDPNWTTLSGRGSMGSGGLMRLSAPEETGDGILSIDLNADGMEGLLGMQFGLNWDGQVLRLEGIENKQLPGFSQEAHSYLQDGSAQVAWDNDILSHVNLVGNQPVMTLHFALQPGADRGTSIELTQPVLVGSQGSERSVMGVASYYHPEGGTMLSSQGLVRSMHRSEGNLSLEFATREGMSYVVESTQDLATGQWEAVTTVEGSGRHEVLEMTTTEQEQFYIRVREFTGFIE